MNLPDFSQQLAFPADVVVMGLPTGMDAAIARFRACTSEIRALLAPEAVKATKSVSQDGQPPSFGVDDTLFATLRAMFADLVAPNPEYDAQTNAMLAGVLGSAFLGVLGMGPSVPDNSPLAEMREQMHGLRKTLDVAPSLDPNVFGSAPSMRMFGEGLFDEDTAEELATPALAPLH